MAMLSFTKKAILFTVMFHIIKNPSCLLRWFENAFMLKLHPMEHAPPKRAPRPSIGPIELAQQPTGGIRSTESICIQHHPWDNKGLEYLDLKDAKLVVDIHPRHDWKWNMLFFSGLSWYNLWMWKCLKEGVLECFFVVEFQSNAQKTIEKIRRKKAYNLYEINTARRKCRQNG